MHRTALVAATLASCAWLAWLCHEVLAPSCVPLPDEVATYRVHAMAGESPYRWETGKVLVGELAVDGQVVPLEELDIEGGWKPSLAVGGPGWKVKEAEVPATLTFDGRSALLRFRLRTRPGWVDIERVGSDEEMRRVLLPHALYEQLVRWVDVPERRPWWPTALFLVLLGGAVALVRPWEGGRRPLAWVMVHAGLAQLIFVLTQPVGGTNDAASYLATGQMILGGGGAGQFPPAYPLLLAVTGLVSSDVATPVSLLQCLMGMATILALWRVLRASFGVPATMMATLVAASSVVFLTTARSVMSEGLTIVCMLGSLAAAVEHRDRGRWTWGVLAGLLAAAATAARIVPIAPLVPVFVALHWRSPQRLRRIAVPCGALAVCVLLPMLVFLVRGHSFSLAYSFGGHLYNSVVCGKRLLDEDGARTRDVKELIVRPEERGYRVWWTAVELIQERDGVGTREAQEILGEVAVEALMAHPFEFVGKVAKQVWGQFVEPPSMPLALYGLKPPELDREPVLGTSGSALNWRHGRQLDHDVHWPFYWASFLAVVLSAWWLARSAGVFVLAWSVFAMLLAQAVGEVPISRYSVPTMSIVMGLGVAGLAHLSGLAAARWGASAWRAVVGASVLVVGWCGSFVAAGFRAVGRVPAQLRHLAVRLAGPRVLQAAVVLLAVVAVPWIGYELWRLLLEGAPKGAESLLRRHGEIATWFGGAPAYVEAGGAALPPASHVLLWPLIGWCGPELARVVWAVTSLAMLAWLVRLVVGASGASTPRQRWLVALLLLAGYAPGATLGNGQLLIHVLPLLVIAGLACDGAGTWARSARVAALFLLALVVPKVALPFLWIALFVGGWRVGALVAAGYGALTVGAAWWQPGGPWTLLNDWWQCVGGEVAWTTGYGRNDPHNWVNKIEIHGASPWLAFTLIAALGVWVFRERRKDPWLLMGVTALVTRFWTYHAWYDDMLLILPMVAVLRCALRDGDRLAGLLVAAMAAAMLAPGGLYVLPWALKGIYVVAQAGLWLVALAFLVVRTARSSPRP